MKKLIIYFILMGIIISSCSVTGLIIEKNPSMKIIDRKQLSGLCMDIFKISDNEFILVSTDNSGMGNIIVQKYNLNKKLSVMDKFINDNKEDYTGSFMADGKLVIITEKTEDNDYYEYRARVIDPVNGKIITDKTVLKYPVNDEKNNVKNYDIKPVMSKNGKAFLLWNYSNRDGNYEAINIYVFDNIFNLKYENKLENLPAIEGVRYEAYSMQINDAGEVFYAYRSTFDDQKKSSVEFIRLGNGTKKSVLIGVPYEINGVTENYMYNSKFIFSDDGKTYWAAPVYESGNNGLGMSGDESLIAVKIIKFDEGFNGSEDQTLYKINNNPALNTNKGESVKANYINEVFFNDDGDIVLLMEGHSKSFSSADGVQYYVFTKGPMYMAAFDKDLKPLSNDYYNSRNSTLNEWGDNIKYIENHTFANRDNENLNIIFRSEIPERGYYSMNADLNNRKFSQPVFLFGASGYGVTLNGKVFKTDSNSFLFIDGYYEGQTLYHTMID